MFFRFNGVVEFQEFSFENILFWNLNLSSSIKKLKHQNSIRMILEQLIAEAKNQDNHCY